MKVAWIVISIFFAYLAIGSLVTGLAIRIIGETDDEGVTAALIVAWPILAVLLVVKIFVMLAINIGKGGEQK